MAHEEMMSSSNAKQSLHASTEIRTNGGPPQSNLGAIHTNQTTQRLVCDQETAQGRITPTPTNPLTPTPATNRDANTAPHMWQALRPGSPGISPGRRHTMSYFPLPGDEHHATRSKTRYAVSYAPSQANPEPRPSPLTKIWQDDGTPSSMAVMHWRQKRSAAALRIVRFR